MNHTIIVHASSCAPEFTLTLSVPDGKDPKLYIDTFLENILNEDMRYNFEWEFASI